MIGMANKEDIRRRHFVEGQSIRRIARETRHSRQYIRKVIAEEVPTIPRYKLSVEKEKPVVGPYLDIITEWLVEDLKRPPKQRHTALRIYERLCDEYGFSGAYSTVRRYVRYIKARLGGEKQEVFIPLEFELGSHAQVDWGEAEIILKGKRQKVYLYDNLKTAVARVLQGKNRKEQEAFIAFRSHYLFEADFCNVGRGNEKGQIEHEIGYLRRKILVPVPEVETVEELNQNILDELLKLYQTRTVSHTKKTIQEVFEQEKELLLPLPRYPFDCCVLVLAKASKESTVRFDSNRYSVPSRYARCRVHIKGYVNEVRIFYEEQLIAVHPRSYEQGQEILDLTHYLDVLERKPYAVNHAKALKQADLPDIYQQYLSILRQKTQKANLEFIKILKLRSQQGAEVVDELLKMAVDCSVYHYDGIRALLDGFSTQEYSPPKMDWKDIKSLPEFHVKPPDLSCYDQLLKGGSA